MGGAGPSAGAGGMYHGIMTQPTDFGSGGHGEDKFFDDTYTYGGGIINIAASVSASIDGKSNYIQTPLFYVFFYIQNLFTRLTFLCL